MSSTPAAPGFGKTFTVSKPAALDYKEGDRVRHIKFGEGTVINLDASGEPFAEVEFDGIGRLKLLLAYAPLESLEN